LIRLAEAPRKPKRQGLSEDELAFYDALAENRGAVEVMGEQELAVIATELVK